MGWWYWFLALLILFVVFYHFIRNNGPSRVGQYYSRRFSSSSAYPTTTLYNHKMPDTMTQKKIRKIAVLPATMNVPLIPFTCELYHALSVTTRVLRLSSKSVVEQLGDEDIVERKEDERLMNWLNSQEDTHDLVIYQCDYPTNNWTRRCLSQADAILVVAHGDQKPPGIPFIDEYLKLNEEGINCSRKELVLLWPDYNANPIGTYEWLNGNWFSGHYHIHSQERMFNWDKNGDNKNENEILAFYENKVFPYVIDIHSDFARLGRILSGNAVGLVLGGGGARGGAHIGVIKALREQNIPIDMIGGTSIGAMVGGVLAMNPYNMDHLVEKSRYWFEGMCSNWKTFLDLTWGFSARFTGFNFNELLKDVFIEKTIEDLWLPYFCITTDITNSVMRVHRNGHLWRYVRASMSLAVYLPPICDPEDGHYLLDGGYMNNLPADVMRNFGARTVIAIDVSLADEKEFHNYGDYLNGFYAQLQALLPWNKGVSRILNAQEIQDRLAFISSVRQLELVKKAPYCNYCRPPIDEFLTLDFAKFDIIREVGYNYAKANVPELMRINNHLAKLVKRELLTRTNSSSNESSLRNSSFTDMAATQSSRTPPKKPSCHSLDDLSKCSSSPTSSSSSSSSKQEIGQDSDSDFVIEEKVVTIPAGEEIIMIEATFKAKISRQAPTNDDDDD